MQDAHPELRAHDDEALHELVVAMNDLRARYFLGRPDKGMRPFFFAYPHEGSTVQMWSVLNAHYVKQLAAAA